jgi:hypothetical protein
MLKSWINISHKSSTITAAIILLITLFGVNDLFTGNSFTQKVLLSLGVALAFYWIFSIFVFLFKRSLHTSYTTVIQRYWKRALYIFWLLELFLFSIYVYLILVAPTEVEWLLDQPQLFSSNWWGGSLFFHKLLPVLSIILVSIALGFVLLNGNFLAVLAGSLALTFLLSSVLFSDLAQTYMYSVYFSGISWDFDSDSNLWVLDGSMCKSRVVTQYMFLITVLKFWHTLFIVGFWLLSAMFLLQSPYTGQGMFASNKQNFYFLYGFAFIWVCFLYKAFANHSYEYVYRWFFVNPWGFSSTGFVSLAEPVLCLL